MRFNGKCAIVTGAASGIGRAVAHRLARDGATLVLADHHAAGITEVASAIGDSARSAVVDVADPLACRALVDTAVEAMGQLDILCNIAGILDKAPLAQLDEWRWDRIIAVNLSGVFHLCRAAMPHLVASEGNIVNMASASALVGVPYSSAYGASKHGVLGLTRALALEFANMGVRINAVCPTGVKTFMISAALPVGIDQSLVARSAPWLNGGELCEPEDVANAVAFLASTEARMITGIALPVDGGQTAG
jgi:meso-butanediol dehydrogenase/(S,S)-butanediol dehydrogenase/diacetyl reductase